MFTPHTKHDVEVMLETIGVGKVEDLFKEIPAQFRYPDLNLPTRLTEMEAAAELESIAAANATTKDLLSFLGAGAYDHYIPAAIDNLLQRGEFYTAYTPYQPEISQGTLQAIFEFQSLICKLTGMDVSNVRLTVIELPPAASCSGGSNPESPDYMTPAKPAASP